jgi:hypothetical protein
MNFKHTTVTVLIVTITVLVSSGCGTTERLPAQAANSTDGAALGDGSVVEGLAQFEVHGTSNSLIGSSKTASRIGARHLHCLMQRCLMQRNVPFVRYDTISAVPWERRFWKVAVRSLETGIAGCLGGDFAQRTPGARKISRTPRTDLTATPQATRNLPTAEAV